MQQANSTSPSMPLMAQTTDFPTINLVSKSERHVPRTIPVSYFTLTCVNTRSGKKFTEAMHRFKHAAMTMQGYEDAWKVRRTKRLANRQLQRIKKYTVIYDKTKQQYLEELSFGEKGVSDVTRQKFTYFNNKLKVVSAKKQLQFSAVDNTCLIPKLDMYTSRRKVEQTAANRSLPDRVKKVHVTKKCLSFSELFEQSYDYENDVGVHPYYTNVKMTMSNFNLYLKNCQAQEYALNDELKMTFRKNKALQHTIVPEAIAIEKELAKVGRNLRTLITSDTLDGVALV
jgi:hypothetical protein